MRSEGRNTLYLALTKSPRLLGLPYGYGILLLVVCVLPLIWFSSLWTLGWCALWYIGLRVASEQDDKAIEAFLKGTAAVPPTQSKRIFGGDSYGP